MNEIQPTLLMPVQDGDNWCWAAVSAAQQNRNPAQSSHPQDLLTQCQVAGLVRAASKSAACANPDAFDVPERLDKALEVVGRLHQADVGRAPFDEIEKEIAANRPICARIVWDQNGDGIVEGAHFVVIVGCSTVNGIPHVKVSDPWGLPTVNITLQKFENSYRDYGVWVATYLLKD